jgi:hypothetical protein
LAARHPEDVGIVEAGDDGFGHALFGLAGVCPRGAVPANDIKAAGA